MEKSLKLIEYFVFVNRHCFVNQLQQHQQQQRNFLFFNKKYLKIWSGGNDEILQFYVLWIYSFKSLDERALKRAVICLFVCENVCINNILISLHSIMKIDKWTCRIWIKRIKICINHQSIICKWWDEVIVQNRSSSKWSFHVGRIYVLMSIINPISLTNLPAN